MNHKRFWNIAVLLEVEEAASPRGFPSRMIQNEPHGAREYHNKLRYQCDDQDLHVLQGVYLLEDVFRRY